MKGKEYERNFLLEGTHWWFRGMYYLYRLMLLDRLKKEGASSRLILDVGSGTGLFTRGLEGLGRVFAVDREPLAIGFCRRRGLVRLVVADACALPFKSASFEAVCAMNIIEHIHDDSGFVREAGRVCKKGASLFLATSAFRFLWSEHDEANMHQRRYTQNSLKMVLGEGFAVEKITYTNFLLFPFIFLAVVLKRVAGPRRASPERSLYPLPAPLNLLLDIILRLEAHFIRYARFPWGVSLFCVARKR